MGVRGYGVTKAQAFAQAAPAMVAVRPVDYGWLAQCVVNPKAGEMR